MIACGDQPIVRVEEFDQTAHNSPKPVDSTEVEGMTRLDPSRIDMVDASPLATWLIDRSTGYPPHNGSIVHANAPARAFLDGDPGTVLEQILSTALDGDASTRPRLVDHRGRAFTLHSGATSDGLILAQAVLRDGWDAVDQVLAEQQRFRSALMELTELAHTTQCDDDFYHRLIERAVEVVPGAQGGSVQINVPGSTEFRFVAAVGYDLDALQQHMLDHRVFFRDAWDPNARLVRDFDVVGRSPEITEWLMTAGRLSEIAVNVSGPVLADGLPIAFLSLDNFDHSNALTETSVEMTTVLSGLIGDLLRRRELEAELRKEREALRHLALHDPLTNLANRRHLERQMSEILTTAAAEGRPSALLFVDVDDFKGVNDRLGHEAGDELLRGVAQRLTALVGEQAVVGRWGGDEFLVVLRNPQTADQATLVADRALGEFEVPLRIGESRNHRARLSIGIGWSQNSHTDVDDLVRAADEALYQAKADGKGVSRQRNVGDDHKWTKPTAGRHARQPVEKAEPDSTRSEALDDRSDPFNVA